MDSKSEHAADADNYRQIADLYRRLDKALGEHESHVGTEIKTTLTAYRNAVRGAARESERFGESLQALQRATKAGNEEANKNALNSLRLTRERMQKHHRTYSGQVDRLGEQCAPRG